MCRVWFDDLALAFWILVVENGRSVTVPRNKGEMGTTSLQQRLHNSFCNTEGQSSHLINKI